MRWLLSLATILTAVDGCLMTGCATTPEAQGSYDAAWKRLEAANFRGHVTASTGGPPLSVGAKNVFWLGPEVNFAFDGDVDFTRTPRVNPTGDPALHASLPMDQVELVEFLQSLPPHPAILAAIDQLDQRIALRLGETQANGK